MLCSDCCGAWFGCAVSCRIELGRATRRPGPVVAQKDALRGAAAASRLHPRAQPAVSGLQVPRRLPPPPLRAAPPAPAASQPGARQPRWMPSWHWSLLMRAWLPLCLPLLPLVQSRAEALMKAAAVATAGAAPAAPVQQSMAAAAAAAEGPADGAGMARCRHDALLMGGHAGAGRRSRGGWWAPRRRGCSI